MSNSIKRNEEIVNLDQADALAYGLVSSKGDNKLDFIPFKFWPLTPDEIRVKILYSSLCLSDVAYSTGEFNLKLLPCVPGHEFVGEIIALGSNITHLQINDIIGYGILEKSCGKCSCCLEGNENLCKSIDDLMIGYPGFGGWATHWQGKAKYAHKIPQEIPLELAAPLLEAGLTVFAPLKRHIIPHKHKELAVIGIGGLGHLAIQYGKAMGLNVTAITTSLEKIEDIKNMGADCVYAFDNMNDLRDLRKIDVAICCFSEGNIDPYLKILKQRGIFIVLTSPEMAKDYLKIDVHFLIHNEISIVGSLFGNSNDVIECLGFSAMHKVFPIVELYDFDDFYKAVDKLVSGKAKYRCVVKCMSHKYPKFNNIY